MITGIYALKFIGTNKVYIGQSIDIQKRFLAHIYTLSNNRGSAKLQEAYNTFGKPYVDIILECSKEELAVIS